MRIPNWIHGVIPFMWVRPSWLYQLYPFISPITSPQFCLCRANLLGARFQSVSALDTWTQPLVTWLLATHPIPEHSAVNGSTQRFNKFPPWCRDSRDSSAKAIGARQVTTAAVFHDQRRHQFWRLCRATMWSTGRMNLLFLLSSYLSTMWSTKALDGQP